MLRKSLYYLNLKFHKILEYKLGLVQQQMSLHIIKPMEALA